MKKIDSYISEKLVIDKDTQINNDDLYDDNARTIAYMFSRISYEAMHNKHWKEDKKLYGDIEKKIYDWVCDNKVKKFKGYYGQNSANSRIKLFEINPQKRDEIINKYFIGQNKIIAEWSDWQLLEDEDYLVLFDIDDIKNIDNKGYVTATWSRVVVKEK